MSDKVTVIGASRRLRDRFELQDGDRVLFLGNTVIEREQRYGYWEAALTTRYPDKNIIFRNLGWSGDTVFGEARARFGTQQDGFDHLEVHVHAVKPSVIICGYGSNAIYQGEPELERFIAGYETLLDSLEATGASIVLMAPLKQESVEGRFYRPDYNTVRERYTQAIGELAERRGCRFFELSQEQNQPLTDNGIHFTDFGYWSTSAAFESALGLQERAGARITIDAEEKSVVGDAVSVEALDVKQSEISFTATPEWFEPPAPQEFENRFATGDADSAALRWPRVTVKNLEPGQYTFEVNGKTDPDLLLSAAVLSQGVVLPDLQPRKPDLLEAIRAKNELYFHRWRPQNETYLFLFRKHEQGNNAVEIPMFDPLVEDLEKKIAELRKPKPVKYVIRRKI